MIDKTAINLIGNPKGMKEYERQLLSKRKELDDEIKKLKKEKYVSNLAKINKK